MESTMLNYDYKLLILDIFQNDKQIYKNAPILIEKIYLTFILTTIYLLAFMIQFIISVYLGRIGLFLHFIEQLTIICNIYLLRKSFILLTLINKFNRQQTLVSDLLNTQILLFLFSLIGNGYLVQAVLNYYMDQTEVTTLIVFETLLTRLLVSNQLKFLIFFLMEVWLILYSLNHFFNDLQFIMQMFLHVQIGINVICVIIQQTVLVNNYMEMNERVELSYETMHDLRNYVQSQIELNKVQVKQKQNNIDGSGRKIKLSPRGKSSRKQTYGLNTSCIDSSNTYDSPSKNDNQYPIDKIEFSNTEQLRINTNKKQSEDKIILDKNSKKQSTESNNTYDANNGVIANFESQFVEEENRCNCRENKIMKAIEFENMDGYYQQKFILYKISFLYHTELIFSNMQNQNPELVNVRDLLQNSCETLQIIFMNKKNSIHIHLHSFVSLIKIDQAIFHQLLVEIIKIFHDQGQSDINIKIMITPYVSSMNLILFVNIKDITSQTQKEVSNKHIIKKLIESLQSGAEFKQKWIEDGLQIDIQLPLDYKELYKEQSKIKRTRSKALNDRKKLSQNMIDTSNTNVSVTYLIENIKMQSKMYQFNKNIQLVYSECILVKKMLEKKNEMNVSENSNKSKMIPINSKENDGINQKPLDNDKNKRNSLTKSNQSKFGKNYRRSSTNNLPPIDKQKALNDLIANVEIIEISLTDNQIQVNVDDELNILKMNKRIFSKDEITLNTSTTISEFSNFLINVQLISKDSDPKPYILCVMDHMLDREWGYEAIDKAQQLNTFLDLDLSFVLLSSTEDKETLEKYTSRGVIKCVSKPLNKGKLKTTCDLFKSIKKIKTEIVIQDKLIKNEIKTSNVVENQQSLSKFENIQDETNERKKVTFEIEKNESNSNDNDNYYHKTNTESKIFNKDKSKEQTDTYNNV